MSEVLTWCLNVFFFCGTDFYKELRDVMGMMGDVWWCCGGDRSW